jgi:hypothetical protein
LDLRHRVRMRKNPNHARSGSKVFQPPQLPLVRDQDV